MSQKCFSQGQGMGNQINCDDSQFNDLKYYSQQMDYIQNFESDGDLLNKTFPTFKSESYIKDQDKKLLLDQQEKISMIDASDNPLDVWLEYTDWVEEYYGKASRTFIDLLEKMLKWTTDCKDRNKVQENEKIINRWLDYAQLCSDTEEIYQYMEDNNIGWQLVVFYETRALHYENKSDYNTVLKIFDLAIKRKAQPQDRLDKILLEFEQRLDQRIEKQFYPVSLESNLTESFNSCKKRQYHYQNHWNVRRPRPEMRFPQTKFVCPGIEMYVDESQRAKIFDKRKLLVNEFFSLCNKFSINLQPQTPAQSCCGQINNKKKHKSWITSELLKYKDFQNNISQSQKLLEILQQSGSKSQGNIKNYKLQQNQIVECQSGFNTASSVKKARNQIPSFNNNCLQQEFYHQQQNQQITPEKAQRSNANNKNSGNLFFSPDDNQQFEQQQQLQQQQLFSLFIPNKCNIKKISSQKFINDKNLTSFPQQDSSIYSSKLVPNNLFKSCEKASSAQFGSANDINSSNNKSNNNYSIQPKQFQHFRQQLNEATLQNKLVVSAYVPQHNQEQLQMNHEYSQVNMGMLLSNCDSSFDGNINFNEFQNDIEYPQQQSQQQQQQQQQQAKTPDNFKKDIRYLSQDLNENQTNNQDEDKQFLSQINQELFRNNNNKEIQQNQPQQQYQYDATRTSFDQSQQLQQNYFSSQKKLEQQQISNNKVKRQQCSGDRGISSECSAKLYNYCNQKKNITPIEKIRLPDKDHVNSLIDEYNTDFFQVSKGPLQLKAPHNDMISQIQDQSYFLSDFDQLENLFADNEKQDFFLAATKTRSQKQMKTNYDMRGEQFYPRDDQFGVSPVMINSAQQINQSFNLNESNKENCYQTCMNQTLNPVTNILNSVPRTRDHSNRRPLQELSIEQFLQELDQQEDFNSCCGNSGSGSRSQICIKANGPQFINEYKIMIEEVKDNKQIEWNPNDFSSSLSQFVHNNASQFNNNRHSMLSVIQEQSLETPSCDHKK